MIVGVITKTNMATVPMIINPDQKSGEKTGATTSKAMPASLIFPSYLCLIITPFKEKNENTNINTVLMINDIFLMA
jgi:hypothetical protein